MQLGSLVLAGVCGMVGLVAGRATRPTPAVVSAAPARVEPARVIAAPPVLAVDTPPAADDDSDGMDVGEAIASAQTQAAAHIAEHNTIRGTITMQNSEPAIGATVVVSGGGPGNQVVITDEHGQYLITQLAAGSYTMTIYYNEQTIERTGVVASEFFATTHDDVIEPPHYEIEGPSDTNNVYTVDVPVRTFEAVLGVTEGTQDDNEGVSFSGGTYLENTYVIDEE